MGLRSNFISAGLRRPAAWAVLGAGTLAAPAWADFSYLNFGSPAALNVVQNSTLYSGALRLTGTTASQVGGAWVNSKQYLAGGFSTTFTFSITGCDGACDATQQPGGDGFAFVIQNYANTGPEFSMPLTGGGLGFNGMSNILAVEFDTWKNDRAQDLDANHISVLTNGTGVLTPEQIYSRGYTSAIPNLSDGNLHTVKIDYTPGTMKVYMDNMATPAVTSSIDLASTLNLDLGRAWVGFTSATGGAWENHDIGSWSLTSAPAPGAAALLGLGLIGTGLRRRR